MRLPSLLSRIRTKYLLTNATIPHTTHPWWFWYCFCCWCPSFWLYVFYSIWSHLPFMALNTDWRNLGYMWWYGINSCVCVCARVITWHITFMPQDNHFTCICHLISHNVSCIHNVIIVPIFHLILAPEFGIVHICTIKNCIICITY